MAVRHGQDLVPARQLKNQIPPLEREVKHRDSLPSWTWKKFGRHG